MLTQADWPQLSHLQLTQYLSGPPNVVPAGLAVSKYSSWPVLKSSCLTGLKGTSDILHAFSQANWALLETFVSEFTEWDAFTISSLTAVSWPALKSLRGRGPSWHMLSIDAESIEILSTAHWPWKAFTLTQCQAT